MIQQTLVLIKPEAIQKNIAGYILTRLGETDLKLIGLKAVHVTENIAKQHYKNLAKEPFFKNVINYLQGKNHNVDHIIAIVYRGENAIERIRELVGDTNPEKAKPHSIRGAFGRISTDGIYENAIHASSCEEDAAFEINLWFKPTDFLENAHI